MTTKKYKKNLSIEMKLQHVSNVNKKNDMFKDNAAKYKVHPQHVVNPCTKHLNPSKL